VQRRLRLLLLIRQRLMLLRHLLKARLLLPHNHSIENYICTRAGDFVPAGSYYAFL
jgi:hypothetical protein